ncbi:hypothetical protein NYO98_10465 [Nocardioides sp. STR2]|uniref:Doublecortin domain-containing protein n=1 Tax=Nocardioides pini TaxID=2975053 RepID=A0ABT4CEA0_9ACTN|nr:hypothetical protein [Nocardioides pini]MCY4726701.1 hypothetical protein [Nocardioides pini]
MIFGQSVVVIRAGERESRAGDIVADWSPSAVTRRLIEGVSVQPNFQNEDTDAGGITRSTGYRVLTAPGATPDIRSTDRIEYRGEVHVVSGEVAFWPDPHGADHIELTMTAWKGA